MFVKVLMMYVDQTQLANDLRHTHAKIEIFGLIVTTIYTMHDILHCAYANLHIFGAES